MLIDKSVTDELINVLRDYSEDSEICLKTKKKNVKIEYMNSWQDIDALEGKEQLYREKSETEFGHKERIFITCTYIIP